MKDLKTYPAGNGDGAILDRIPDIIGELDRDYRYRLMNAAGLEEMGREREEVIGKTVREIFGEAFEKSGIKRRLDRCLEGEAVDYLRPYGLKEDRGRWIRMHYYPRKGADGRVEGIVLHGVDVTALMEAEERQKHLNRQMETIKSINRLIGRAKHPEELIEAGCRILVDDPGCDVICLVLLSPEGKPELIETCGLGEAAPEFEDRLRKAFPPAFIEKAVESDRINLFDHDCELGSFWSGKGLKGVPTAYAFPIRHENRTYGYMLAVPTEPLATGETFDWAGEICGDLAFALHALNLEAERKRTVEALETATLEAREANRAKSRFLSMMSHEIRTPLNGVIGISEYLRQLEWDKDVEEALRVLTHSGEMLLELINDILDYSKIEADRMEIVPGPVNLREQLDGFGKMLEQRSRMKNQHFLMQTDLKNGLHELDWPRLRQVLLNLASNAMKFTPPRGQIRLTVSEEADGSLFLEVADTGVGIPHDRLGELFEPFTQVGASMEARSQGTGLGLAICKSLMDRMNGRIDVLSTPGKGSSFTLCLPARVLEADAEEQSDVVLRPDLHGTGERDMQSMK